MYDLIVVGGGTSGCACAYTASKMGLKVLLIEKNTYLGGSMTGGLVIPMMKNNVAAENTQFYNNLLTHSKKFGASMTYCDDNEGWFNPQLLKFVLEDMLLKTGVEIYYDTQLVSVQQNVEQTYIYNISVLHRGLSLSIESKYYVDATGDGNFSTIAGCKNLQNENEIQQTSLRFILGNVDKKRFADWIYTLDKNRDVTTACNTDDDVHFSTAYTWDEDKNWALKPYFEAAVNDGTLEYNDTAYFQLFTVAKMPSCVAFNCPRIFTDDNLTPINTSKALQEGRSRMLRIVKFAQKYLPGFENATIVDVADMLGVRASRRIECESYRRIDEIDKVVNSPILTSDYPIDIHAKDKNNSSLKKIPKPYSISIENLKSKKLKNLYIVGRCIGVDFFCQSALRIQINCMSMGEAVAKEICLRIKNSE